MERDQFVASVEDALANLYDLTYLGGLSLRQTFARDTGTFSADRLHHVLIDAVTSLRPLPGSPTTTASWRRHHYLEQRYLAGQSHKAVASELGLSVRQAHRVRAEAIYAVASALWEGPLAVGRPTRDPSAEPLPRESATSTETRGALDDELARLAREGSSSLVDLTEELREALATIGPLARQRGIELDVTAGSWPVSADRAPLRQAIVLLLSYAVDRQTGGRIWVSIDAEAPAVALDVVFEPGRSSPNAETGDDARLDAAQRLVEAQGGTLEPLPGTEGIAGFRVQLRHRKTSTVLTIDDNPDLAQLFDLYLQRSRYRVARAKTGPAAIRMAEQGGVDVVTLDVMMPFQDGWEIFRQLQANPSTRRIPVVVCSILPEKELALALGAADFLAKPVTRPALIAVLDRCCPSESVMNPDLA